MTAEFKLYLLENITQNSKFKSVLTFRFKVTLKLFLVEFCYCDISFNGVCIPLFGCLFVCLFLA